MADLKWHRYDPDPEVKSIEEFLALVEKDEYGCFFGKRSNFARSNVPATAVCVRDTLVSERCFRSIGFSVDPFAA